MKSEKQKAMFSAYHEAGHHCLAWYYGCKLGKISIQPGNGFFGTSQTYIPENRDSFHANIFTPQRVFELIAGRAASEVFCPDVEQENSYKRDFSIIKNLNGDSEMMLKMNTWRVDNPAGDMESFYQEFKQPIIDILQSEQGKRAIQALAKALQKAGYLSGRESARIMETAWGVPLPPFALPSDQHPSLDGYTPAKTFNDFLFQMSLFENLLRKEVSEWIGNDELTPKEQRIAEDFSAGVNHLRMVLKISIDQKI